MYAAIDNNETGGPDRRTTIFNIKQPNGSFSGRPVANDAF